MEDSHFSDPEYQVVLETEAEDLMVQDSERILERETPETRKKLVPTFLADPIPDLPGTKDVSPAGPPTILGGTLAGLKCYYTVQGPGLLISK